MQARGANFSRLQNETNEEDTIPPLMAGTWARGNPSGEWRNMVKNSKNDFWIEVRGRKNHFFEIEYG